MRLHKILFGSLFLMVFTISCEKDEEPEIIPERDRTEQELADQEALEAYLETHFYNYEEFENPGSGFDYVIEFDTISGTNSDKISLMESDLLQKKTVTFQETEYSFYILKIREGVNEQPKFSDSTFVTYAGELLSGTQFDSSTSPIWFDLTRVIPGFSQSLSEFKGASGFVVNADNTVTWNNDYGVGAVFLPSGLGYYSNPQSEIPAYSPLVFSFKLFGVNEADHDRDGIPSWMEDLNEDENVTNDDTDGDGGPNYIDIDDDNDFIFTKEEIVINEDGTITFPDTDNDGTVDHLDSDM
ncbi:MAG TPA: FKBP-type peptidyl-prolyl cis-trans isomerase [Salinimicrobium sp.]|nr:FKBP-type peptidyl-prolyl cis-trans isomerase [Salinimicrobium sp.]